MKVAEIANLLGVSKKTIYRRVDSLSLSDKGHMTRIGKEKHVDLEGVELIRVSIDKGLSADTTKDNVAIDTVTKLEDHAIKAYKEILQEQKELYEKLLVEKDRVIGEKNHLIDDLRKDKDKLMAMNENHQVLLAREQEKKLLLDHPAEKNNIFKGLFKRKHEEA